jgi:hypothetical protein
MPHPCGGSGWPVSSPAMKRRPSAGSSQKQICALMSRPLSGSSFALVNTCCVSNGGAPAYALRLFPSPLNTAWVASPGAGVDPVVSGSDVSDVAVVSGSEVSGPLLSAVSSDAASSLPSSSSLQATETRASTAISSAASGRDRVMAPPEVGGRRA